MSRRLLGKAAIGTAAILLLSGCGSIGEYGSQVEFRSDDDLYRRIE